MHIVVPCRKRFLRTALIVGLALGGLIALTGKVFIDITTQKAAPLVAKMLREAIVEVKRNGAPAKRDLANLVLKRDYSDLFLWSIGLASYELQGIEGSARPKKVLAPANIGMAEVEAALHSGAFFPAPKFSKDHHLHPAILKQAEWFDERDYKERMVTLFIYVAAPALFLLIFVTALLLTLPRYRAARAELRRLSGGRPAQARG